MAAIPNISERDTREYKDALVSNTEALSRFGGRLAVMCKFVDAALPQLSEEQRKEVAVHFRHGIESLMSVTDDIAMPAEYHEALLEQTNVLLTALNR